MTGKEYLELYDKHLEDEKVEHKTFDSDDSIAMEVSINAYQKTSLVFGFRDDDSVQDNSVQLVGYCFCFVPQDKKGKEIYKILNEMNMKYRYVKFAYYEDENEVILLGDVSLNGDDFVNDIDSTYKKMIESASVAYIYLIDRLS